MHITLATSIQSQLQELMPLNFDVIALVRGGGPSDRFDAFNDVALAKLFIALQPDSYRHWTHCGRNIGG